MEGALLDPLKFFVPTGKQEELINTVANSINETKIPVTLCTFANGTGKTTTIINMLLNFVYGPQNGWFNKPIFQNFPFPKTIWYCSDSDAIKQTILPEIKRLLKLKKDYREYKDGKPYTSRISFDNGWQIVFKSFEQDPSVYESANVGCIEENERILMSDGRWIRIKDIKVGDSVIAYGSKHAWVRAKNQDQHMPKGQNVNKVTAKIVHKDREMLEIKGLGGFSVKCTPDHRFWIYGKGWVEAQDIKPNMELVRQNIDIKGRKTCETWQSFLLGALIGDGCLTGKSVHFTSYNDRLNSQIAQMLPDGYGMSKIKPGKSRPDRQEYLFTTKQYNENQIKNWLKEIGIWGHKSNTKFIPDIIFQANKEIKKNFIEALFATDGWFSGREIGYASTSKRLVNDLKLLLQEMGINSNVYFRQTKNENWRDQWFLIVTKSKEVIRFCKMIKVDSKKEAQNKILNIALKARKGMKQFGISLMGGTLDMSESLSQRKSRKKIKVTSIKLAGTGNVIDIQTDPNHNFVINGVVTHNCMIIDEPMPQNLWKAAKSRRRKGCISVMIMTPLFTPPYVLDEVQKNIDEDKPGYFHVMGDVYTACKKRGKRGYLDADIVDAMVSDYDEDEREARAFGKFMYFSSMIYPGLKKELHFVDPEEYPLKSHYLYYHVVDPHDGRANAEIWAALTPEGRFIVFDELPDNKNISFWDMKSPVTIDENIQQIMFKEKEHLIHPKRIMDRYFGLQTRGVYKKNLFDEYADRGLHFVESYKTVNRNTEISYGHNKVRQLLKYLPDGKPGLVIWNTCYHAWNGISHYIRKRETSKRSNDRPLADGKLVEKYKDYPDLFRYLVCADSAVYEKDHSIFRDTVEDTIIQNPMSHIL
ncbi:MAG: hypothetical protein H8E13_03370 [Actinobacteria bacterium]|nr:hypothetical protein [Actinomycetota bacterium]